MATWRVRGGCVRLVRAAVRTSGTWRVRGGYVAGTWQYVAGTWRVRAAGAYVWYVRRRVRCVSSPPRPPLGGATRTCNCGLCVLTCLRMLLKIVSQAGRILAQLLRPARPGCRGVTAVYGVPEDGVPCHIRPFGPQDRPQRAGCCSSPRSRCKRANGDLIINSAKTVGTTCAWSGVVPLVSS